MDVGQRLGRRLSFVDSVEPQEEEKSFSIKEYVYIVTNKSVCLYTNKAGL
jgi:hypothetical protein